MKRMTKLLLINWHYFSRELVEFDSINFLTGKNKSGKSTIIDALQVVLMGETRGYCFNRAANKKSDRSLKSYLIGSMGEDIDDGKKSLRGGKDFTSYIVAELFDDVKGEFFCLGASFDSFADGSDERKRFFWMRSSLPHEQFIHNNRPMDTKALKIYLDTNFKNKSETKDTNDAYQKLLLAKLNIHDPRMFSMLKSAISFEPINDIEKFITDNVCHIEEDINIEDMQQNIAYYKKQEQLAKSFSEKLLSLEKIGQLYSELESLRSTRQIQSYLIQRAENQNFADSLEEAKIKARQYENDIAEFQEQYGSIENLISKLQEKEKKLQGDIIKYRLDHNIDTLQDEIKKLKSEIDDITQSIKRFITDLRANVARWQEFTDHAISELEQQDYDDVVQVLKDVRGSLKCLEAITEDAFSQLSAVYFSKLREKFIFVRDKLDPIAKSSEKEKDRLTAQTSTLKSEIEQLKKGIKSYPQSAQKLKDTISDALYKKYNKSISVSFLADLIDISDDKWTDAIEGYLNTQRMYLIVDPEYFMEVYRIYKNVRHEIENCEYRIIDCEKVYYASKNIVEESLSQVVTAENKYAKAYIEYVLGGVTRCYNDSRIRENKTSITQSCMLYKNFTVGPINKWAYQTHYVGQKSITQQIDLKTKQLLEATSVLKGCTIFCNAIVPVVKQEWFLTESYVQNSVVENFTLLERKKHHLTELAEKQNLWEKIDLLWLDRMQDQVNEITEELKKQYDERQNTYNFIQNYTEEKNKTVMQTIPKLEEELSRTTEEVAQQYEEKYVLEIGEPRFLQEQQRLGNAKAVFERFELFIKNTHTLIGKKEDEVRDTRSEYNREQNISFRANDVETNNEYQKEYEKIRDYELPAYRTRISKAKEDAMEQFKSDFLYRLKSNIETVMEKIEELNAALRLRIFENDTYRFEVKPNASMIEYYNLIMSSELQSGELDLFSCDFTQKYGSTIENLFSQIVDISEDNIEKHSSKAAENIQTFSQYKTYLTFDLLVKDANGITKRLSESSGTNSGGEGQTPFYIATLASFAQLYKVNDYSEYGNTFRLVIFDEAFNKMDQERITESIKFLRRLGLQAIVCAPPDKVADVAPLADKTLLVYKEESGGKCKSRVIEWTKEMGESVE